MVIEGERPWAPERGRPSWAALVVVAVLAALFGGGVVAAFSRAAGPATALAAPTAGGTAQEPAASATPAARFASSDAAPSAAAPAPKATPTLPAATAAPPPPSPTARPPARPSAQAGTVATVAADATPRDLAGQVASTRPGTPIALGRPVTSVIDRQAKPHDVYALALRAGQTLHVEVSAMTEAFDVLVAPPDAEDLLGEPGVPNGALLCNYRDPCRRDFPIAADGTYTLVIGTDDSGVRYTLRADVR